MGDASERKDKLLKEIEEKCEKLSRRATVNTLMNSFCFYGSMASSAGAVILGIVGDRLQIPDYVISIFAATAGGLNFWAKNAKFRARADWCHHGIDIAQNFIHRLEFQTPERINFDTISAISFDWRTDMVKLTSEMNIINATSSQDSAVGPKK